ncbi:MAG: hypothetical protein WCE23_12485 [Candidatus Binatus sp.]|uniref:hypothetical protein n=1 Tax=Candidatus Binatus sp. TaxID=2811406 RepID=UPI003C776E53
MPARLTVCGLAGSSEMPTAGVALLVPIAKPFFEVVLFLEKTLLLVKVDVHGRASDHQYDHHHHGLD